MEFDYFKEIFFFYFEHLKHHRPDPSIPVLYDPHQLFTFQTGIASQLIHVLNVSLSSIFCAQASTRVPALPSTSKPQWFCHTLQPSVELHLFCVLSMIHQVSLHMFRQAYHSFSLPNSSLQHTFHYSSKGINYQMVLEIQPPYAFHSVSGIPSLPNWRTFQLNKSMYQGKVLEIVHLISF